MRIIPTITLAISSSSYGPGDAALAQPVGNVPSIYPCKVVASLFATAISVSKSVFVASICVTNAANTVASGLANAVASTNSVPSNLTCSFSEAKLPAWKCWCKSWCKYNRHIILLSSSLFLMLLQHSYYQNHDDHIPQ